MLKRASMHSINNFLMLLLGLQIPLMYKTWGKLLQLTNVASFPINRLMTSMYGEIKQH